MGEICVCVMKKSPGLNQGFSLHHSQTYSPAGATYDDIMITQKINKKPWEIPRLFVYTILNLILRQDLSFNYITITRQDQQKPRKFQGFLFYTILKLVLQQEPYVMILSYFFNMSIL